jgi:hypothetical protein
MAVTVRTKGHIEAPASLSTPARPAVPAICEPAFRASRGNGI